MDGKFINRRTFLKTGSLYILGSTIPVIAYSYLNKSIILIGDSIRVGYQEYVSLFLEGNAEVWFPEDSGIHSVDVLEEASEWLKEHRADVIHINSGLEDIKCIPAGSRNNLIPLEQYSVNIERIIKFIHQHRPGVVTIFATTTPVIDDKVKFTFQERQEFMVYNEDIIKYNESMKGICGKMGIPVNDLFEFVMSGDPSLIMLKDGIHFSERGYELIGEKVADAIRVFLQ